ncbi:hypothetical protein As57867_002728, partial [Aphanomyces stellatus]
MPATRLDKTLEPTAQLVHFQFRPQRLKMTLAPLSTPAKLKQRRSSTTSSGSECPFANPDTAISDNPTSHCPFHAHKALPTPASIQGPVDLVVDHGTFTTTAKSANLLHDIGGGDKIREVCTRFYARAFLDDQLKPFFFEEDGATAHGQRLADWIVQKMGGEGTPWSDSGRWGMRQPSHAKA